MEILAQTSILIGGLGLLFHQVWLQARGRRAHDVLAKPRTWQQRLGMTAVALAVVVLLLVIALDVAALPLTGPLAGWLRAAGLALFALGIALRLLALADLGKSYAPDLRISAGRALVTGGIYGRVRHPFYLSALLLIAGAGLALLNGLVLGLVAPLWLALLHRIRLEEAMLHAHFGPPYADYCRQTPRLLPALFCRRPKSRRGLPQES